MKQQPFTWKRTVGLMKGRFAGLSTHLRTIATQSVGLALFAWLKSKAAYKRADAWLTKKIDESNPYDPERLKARAGLDPAELLLPPGKLLASKLTLGLGVLFLIWAFFAPLDQGVFVQGNLAVAGNRKLVQHPTGGVVTEILVKEGQEVKRDEVLIRINPLDADANLTSAQLQLVSLQATESRLRAERDGKVQISFPPELIEQAKFQPAVAEALDIQDKLFQTRRADYANRLASQRIQVQTLTIEAAEAAQLAKEGFMSQAQASGILRNKAVADAELSKLTNGRLSEIDAELAETQKTRDALEQKVEALAFDASLNNIKAPVAGVVTGLKVNTVGGVVNASQPILEVVPTNETLIVEVRIPTLEAAKAQVGMEARLRFVSLPSGLTPVVEGTLVLIGADKVASDKLTELNQDNQKGEFYIGRIELTPDAVKQLSGAPLSPGMPLEVVLKAGERSFMSYLFKPVFDSFARSFLQ